MEPALAAKGQRLGENDNWIAATALYQGEPIVTNDNDFSRVTRARLPLKILRKTTDGVMSRIAYYG